MILMELSMFPLDKGESVGEYVGRSMDIIDKSGVPYKLNPMGTVMEGEWDELIKVMKDCFEAMQKDCRRIEATIKMDYRQGSEKRLDAKTASVEKRVGRSLKK